MTRTFCVLDVATSDQRILPILIVGCNGQERVSHEVLRYVSFLRNRGDSLQRMRAACYTLGLLLEYVAIVRGDRPVNGSDLPSIVSSFMRARRTGNHHKDDGSARDLKWQVVQRETVRRDRYFIAEFAEFCVDHLGASPFRSRSQGEVSGLTPSESLALRRLARISSATRNTNLLHHISHLRRSRTGLPFDIAERRVPIGTGVKHRRFVFLDEIRRIIDSTSSLMQKMLLIEAYFGGPRVSEMLHQWRCDVLPGSLRHAIFPDDDASILPLVLLAHPSQAKYVGELSRARVDRLQHLANVYGTLPRTMMEGTPLYAGWKGMQFDNQGLGVSQIYWANREYALLYAELYKDVRRTVYANISPDVLSSHPYLYVNDAPGKREHGQPLKMSNARKVFIRACERLDASGSFRNGPHGARHAYKAMIEKLLPEDRDVQKCLHHGSVFSQRSYAKDASRVGNTLRQLIEQ